jgi:arylsulfatase A-like enzyme
VRVTGKRGAILAACVLAAICALAIVPLRGQARTPNVLMIVIDTLRADRVGAYGNPRGLTPFLDELAKRGTVFTNAYAPSSWTCPSIASLFTSRYASQHHVTTFNAQLNAEEVTLAEILGERGYIGAGFSANFRLAETHGYAQGFGHWRTFVSREDQSKVRGPSLRAESGPWLRKTQAARPGAPLFVYLQYMEPHAPYQPLDAQRRAFAPARDGVDEAGAMAKLVSVGSGTKQLSGAELELLAALYDAEVASVDAELRTLFADLQASGFLDNAIIVITADHGEEFGEHGELLHGVTLYNAAIRIPLIIVAPGVGEGRVVRDNASLIDVAPTLLDLLGVSAEPTFEGRSLVPLMTAAEDPPPRSDVLSELEPIDRRRDGRTHSRAFMRGMRKLLVKRVGGALEYDLVKDPGEQHGTHEPRARIRGDGDLWRALVQKQRQLTQRVAKAQVTQPLDDAAKEQLRALGYQP